MPSTGLAPTYVPSAALPPPPGVGAGHIPYAQTYVPRAAPPGAGLPYQHQLDRQHIIYTALTVSEQYVNDMLNFWSSVVKEQQAQAQAQQQQPQPTQQAAQPLAEQQQPQISAKIASPLHQLSFSQCKELGRQLLELCPHEGDFWCRKVGSNCIYNRIRTLSRTAEKRERDNLRKRIKREEAKRSSATSATTSHWDPGTLQDTPLS
ncbi:uncharacterized protein LOC108157956 [Drosophila miranda]|uniref:uncharacterized protein LOC108157956 n=1 Tax=Drosophila miranda TaxID=7229 RepID=UPI00143FB1CE|nr:uncharacterized protein LOC108157956 [Drosophila miranda]